MLTEYKRHRNYQLEDVMISMNPGESMGEYYKLSRLNFKKNSLTKPKVGMTFHVRTNLKPPKRSPKPQPTLVCQNSHDPAPLDPSP